MFGCEVPLYFRETRAALSNKKDVSSCLDKRPLTSQLSYPKGYFVNISQNGNVQAGSSHTEISFCLDSLSRIDKTSCQTLTTQLAFGPSWDVAGGDASGRLLINSQCPQTTTTISAVSTSYGMQIAHHKIIFTFTGKLHRIKPRDSVFLRGSCRNLTVSLSSFVDHQPKQRVCLL